jgi:ubiquitin-like protein Pup
MPQRENAERKPARTTDAVTDDQAAASTAQADRKAAIDADVDSLLDEIDDVLEVNAEEFVKSFVQKGGQ